MLEIVKRALAALREQRAAAHAELNAIAPAIEARGADATATPEEEARAAALIGDITTLDAKIAEHEARVAELEQIEARAVAGNKAVAAAGLQFIKPTEPAHIDDVRAMNVTQLTDVIKRGAEERGIDSDHAAKIINRHAGKFTRNPDLAWARGLAARSTDAYASAFAKVFTGDTVTLTPEERAAIAVGTNTQGGFLVPTHLDPTIILTNSGTTNVVRQISRVETLTQGKVWNGISSAGITASFDAELAEVSDDSPSVAGPSVTLYTARALIMASIEAYEDIDGLSGQALAMFADARDRLEATKHCQGTGSSEPFGIFVAITNSGSQAIVSDTAATIALADLLEVKTSLTPRFRRNASWVYSPTWGDAIRVLGTALNASYTMDATGMNTDRLLGYNVYETDDAPSVATTTVKDAEIIFGDFSNFVIVDKPGSFSVSFIPPGTLTSTTTNLPNGSVGWFAWWRTGSDSVNDAAFRVLVDKTSA